MISVSGKNWQEKITNNNVLSGIDINNNNYTSETLVTHKNSNFKKIIKRTNLIKE